MIRIAVLMASHNRRDQTVASLNALRAAMRRARVTTRLFLTDDGSTDGTPDAVKLFDPSAVVVSGTGSLFWAASMSLAEEHAAESAPDYYLWLNDDTVLDPEGLETLLQWSTRMPESIIVGALRDPVTGALTYGGRRRLGVHPQRFALLGVSDAPVQADTFNGNLVLIPRRVRDRVGAIDGGFPHAYADDDYGLRATSLGVRVIQVPGTQGTCSRNAPRPIPTSLRGRWASIQNPKGTPWSAQARYLRRHGPWWWPALLVGGHARKLFFPRTAGQ